MSTYNPYQEASEAINRQSEAPIKALKKGAGLALNVATSGFVGGAAGGILSRILPFLSKHIAPTLAVKGISKIHNGLGKGIDAALKMGYSFDEVSDLLRKEIVGGEEEKQPGELSRASLQQQFQEGYPEANQQMTEPLQQPGMVRQGQGKAALAPIIAEAVQILRSLKRGG